MSSKNNPPDNAMRPGDEPAFPAKIPHVNTKGQEAADFAFFGGMTQREAFAIRFAAAIVSSPRPPRLVDAHGGQLDMSHPSIIALTAVGLADALVAELAREPQT